MSVAPALVKNKACPPVPNFFGLNSCVMLFDVILFGFIQFNILQWCGGRGRLR
jgi:hypothetical protein